MCDRIKKRNRGKSSRITVLLLTLLAVPGASFAQSAREVAEKFIRFCRDLFGHEPGRGNGATH